MKPVHILFLIFSDIIVSSSQRGIGTRWTGIWRKYTKERDSCERGSGSG